MANKTFNTRVKNKRDTAANWEAVATTFQPLDGELIIVDTSAGKTRFKVGRYDTAKGRLLYYNEIPFADEYLYNDLNESQGKIYDKLKGIDDKSIIEMTLESVFDNTKFVNYRIGLWQFPKTGFYKLNIAKRGTTATQLFLYAQKTKEDGTTPEDPFSQDNLLRISPLTGDKQVESVFVQVDYTDTDTLTVYKVQFLNVMTFPGTININTYNKTTQKWDFTSVTESSAKWANNATQVSNALTLTKGDTTTKFDGSTAQTVEIPTKTSELTNDSFVSYAEQTLTEDQQNQAKTNLGIDVLTGNTTTVTPTQVKEAILAGRPVAITHVDNTYGNLLFTSFGYSLENNVVVANLVSTYNTQYILADLVGMSNNDQWSLNTAELGTSTDIDNLQLNMINNYVKYSEAQTLTDGQKAQARTNIGAISEADLVQPDWNQNDATAKDYIKNRICYENSVSIPATVDSPNSSKTNDLTIEELQTFHNWCEGTSPVNLKINNTVYILQPGGFADGIYTLNYNNTAVIIHSIRGTSNHLSIREGFPEVTAGLNFTLYVGEIKQIDKKYIPDEAFTQANWNQNDTSSPAYIQNKPNIPKVDTELSTTSTNPVQNKAVKAEIDSLQASIDGKADITALNYGLTQVINYIAANYVKFTAEQTLTDEQKAQARDNINAPSPADAVYTATAASTDGVAYTATVSGIDSLTVGASFIMIPNKASTSKAPTLNVNGLGAKPIRRRLSSLTTSLQQGYSTNWIALNKPFTVVYDGTAWVIEGLTKTDGADVYGAVAQATADAKGNNIADTYATIAMLQSLLPKVTTITLTSNWVGDASPYYQDIALSCVTETSIVDLQPTPDQLNSWQDDGIAFTTLSGNGTVRVYVAGGKPSSAISVQIRVQEVTVI